jgi:hypothetical protein
MRLFLLSVAVFGLIGVGAAWAADEPVATTSTDAAQASSVEPSASGSQDAAAAVEERSLAQKAQDAIGQQKCEALGKKYDIDLEKCVSDENVEFRYERKWDPLFGDTPVPEPLFNNVR